MNVKKALKLMKKGKPITHKSWSKDIGFEMVISRFVFHDGKKKYQGRYTQEDFLSYHSDYHGDHKIELENQWKIWTENGENQKYIYKLNNLIKKKEDIDNQIERVRRLMK